MDVPIQADVECRDGHCGQSTRIIFKPDTDEITHIVVRQGGIFGEERIVPLEYVTETTPKTIRLRAGKEELEKFPPFLETDYVPVDAVDPTTLWPDAEGIGTYPMPISRENIPGDELSLFKGMAVEATDGRVGRVDEFLLDPANNQISHVVMREGHLWGAKDVVIPVTQIQRIDEDAVYLTLSKHEVEELPGKSLREE
ncbi:MAG: PRC-barrel domain-containing protein [Caldilineaceae bacterium]|nr:PRC-barrel domain-containing protein [Caldilineaceae bacterium]